MRAHHSHLGDLRWRAPIAPLPENDILSATSQPAKCSQRKVSPNGTLEAPDPTSVEDCLFLNVYTPPLNSFKENLPVLVWIHGGGYFFGDAAAYDRTAMIQASKLSFVAVVIQYRLGVFGFLPGSEVKKNGELNAGLLDIEFALKWTQENIYLFGGDPEQVTIWGESAGGGAVLMQVVAHEGKTQPALFKHAIASSPYLPPSYRYDDSESEMQYTNFVKSSGCANATDTLGCLRGLGHATLLAKDTGSPRPVVDETLLVQRPKVLLERKQVNGERLISLHNGDEGRLIVARDTNSTVPTWLTRKYPRLSQQNVTAIENTYQVFTSGNASEADNIYTLQIMILAESVFVCPSLWLADAFPQAGYKGIFAVPPALHAFDLAVYFPDIGFSFIQPAHPISRSLTQSFMGALVSFVLTGSPNKNPMNPSINPTWETFDQMDPKAMLFNITTSGTADPQLQKVDAALLHRCNLWTALAPFTQQ